MMRRRFGRRGRAADGDRGVPIDESWLAKAQETLGLEGLERIEAADLPDHFALAAKTTGEGGAVQVVAVSPRSGGDALLAAIVAAQRVDATGARALAPSWDTASRRRLAAFASAPEPRILAGGDATVNAETGAVWIPERRLADAAGSDEARALFRRAAGALEGLAQKHGGAVRSGASALELVLLGKPVAALRATGSGVVLETLLPSRSEQRLAASDLADAFDRLEGAARKRLNDRRVREGEEGQRTRGIPLLVAAHGLRAVRRWPLGGSGEALDCVGVSPDGSPVVGAVRDKLGLVELGTILDAALAAEPLLAFLLEDADAPLLLTGRPRLAIAAGEVTPAAATVLSQLLLPVALYELAGDSPLRPVVVEQRAAAQPEPAKPARRERPAPEPREASEAAPEVAETEPAEVHASPEGDAGDAGEVGEDRPRRRRRRGRGRSRGRATGEAQAREGGPSEPEEAEPDSGGGFEELSFLDLEEDDSGEGRSARGGRRRRRRRSGAGAADDSVTGSAPAAQQAEGDDEGEPGSQRRRGKGRARRGRGKPAEAASSDEERGGEDDDEDDDLLQLAPDAPDFEAEVPDYEDEEEGEPESELDRIRIAREKRRRERDAATAIVIAPEGEGVEVATEELPEPRGRAAILAHADRQSIAAATLLAREARHVEGVWVYPQEDLMTFFRGVATDLREGVPIYVVGFAAKPARDVLQAASLYRGRIVWFDHHEWPPEDLAPMREAVGENLLRLIPGAGSALPAAVGFCTRRSRFSDKLVDLVTGRFSHHDFQRWGRLWWWRLGEIAAKTGDRRADLDLLLGGRPSDLAREAGRAAPPPLPAEVEYVSRNDLRLVHFGGLAMVEAVLPPELDLHLVMRVARERYGAVLSLGRHAGSERVVLGADDVTGRRAVDVTGMVEHLAEKFAWVHLLPDDDHVARLRVDGIEERPDRLDELVAEIGMSRSTLEG